VVVVQGQQQGRQCLVLLCRPAAAVGRCWCSLRRCGRWSALLRVLGAMPEQ
jgi:hypothetical protein